MSQPMEVVSEAPHEVPEEVPWPRTPESYELRTVIGEGAFAKVWVAYCPAKKMEIAVKVMNLDVSSESLLDVTNETQSLHIGTHPNLLQSYTHFLVNINLWMVMPFMRKGSCLRIMRYLSANGFGDGLKEDWIAVILKAALEGIKFFHSQDQLHRDIKAANLLVDSDGTVVISDFGVSGFTQQMGRRSVERRTFVGTPCWMAPEVMEQTSPYDEKADIWSFGITALELAKGYAPYARLNPMEVMIQTIREDPPSLKTYEGEEGVSKRKFTRPFKEIISFCLQKNPKMRPSAATLLTRPFFMKAKGNQILVKELLEAIPIPDATEPETLKEIPKAEVKEKTSSQERVDLVSQETMNTFVPGTTWDFADEHPSGRPKKGKSTVRPSPLHEEAAPIDFAAAYDAANIDGEDA